MSNIIDSIRLSGTTYQIQGSGGGKAIEAGRGITITTGETADTVSFSLPISAGTGSNSIIEGNGTTASGFSSHAEGSYSKARGSYSHAEGFGANANGASSHAEGGATNADGSYSHAEGDTTTAKGNYSHTEGRNTIANNLVEHASGQYNNSVSASTTFGDSGNTLFSVGNGTSTSARHNAFEIRQNGDIYLTKDGQDVKLQDQLGGGSIDVDNALSPTSENPVQNKVLFDELRITESEGSETKLIWEEVGYYDFRTTNFPSGYTTIKVVIKDGEAVSFVFHNSNSVQLGTYTIANISELEVTNSFDGSTYTVDGNNVTITWDASKDVVELATDGGGEVYDYMAEFYAVDEPVYSTLKEVVSGKVDTDDFEIYSGAVESRIAENEEVTASGLNALNDKFDGLRLKKISQSDYDNLQVKDPNTLYIITD